MSIEFHIILVTRRTWRWAARLARNALWTSRARFGGRLSFLFLPRLEGIENSQLRSREKFFQCSQSYKETSDETNRGMIGYVAPKKASLTTLQRSESNPEDSRLSISFAVSTWVLHFFSWQLYYPVLEIGDESSIEDGATRTTVLGPILSAVKDVLNSHLLRVWTPVIIDFLQVPNSRNPPMQCICFREYWTG